MGGHHIFTFRDPVTNIKPVVRGRQRSTTADVNGKVSAPLAKEAKQQLRIFPRRSKKQSMDAMGNVDTTNKIANNLECNEAKLQLRISPRRSKKQSMEAMDNLDTTNETANNWECNSMVPAAAINSINPAHDADPIPMNETVNLSTQKFPPPFKWIIAG